MAIRLEKMGWGTADGWVSLQVNYELAQVRQQEHKIKVNPLRLRICHGKKLNHKNKRRLEDGINRL